jgi:SOS-response transcriptional repressor LexA
MNTPGLTHRQRELYLFIAKYIEDHGGVAPSYQEMVSGIAAKSKGHVAQLVESLVERGYLIRGDKHKARTLTLVDRNEREIAA